MHAKFLSVTAVVLMILILGCSKDSITPKNANELIAFIVQGGTTNTTRFASHGDNTKLVGCDIWGLSTYISAYDEDTHAKLGFDVSENIMCIKSTGTYKGSGYYYLWKTPQSSSAYDPDYDTYANTRLQTVSGTITFLEIDENHMVGNFNFVLCCSPMKLSCTYQKDSVLVTGYFSGNKID